MRAGDVVLIRGRGWLSRAIRALTRSPGEPPTRVSHVALAINSTHVIEAIAWKRVRIRPRDRGQAYSCKILDAEMRAQVVRAARAYEGSTYGYTSVALAGLDGLLGGINLFRRFSSTKHPDCSQLVAGAYAVASISFGIGPREATPDDLSDWIHKFPNMWEMVP